MFVVSFNWYVFLLVKVEDLNIRMDDVVFIK